MCWAAFSLSWFLVPCDKSSIHDIFKNKAVKILFPMAIVAIICTMLQKLQTTRAYTVTPDV